MVNKNRNVSAYQTDPPIACDENRRIQGGPLYNKENVLTILAKGDQTLVPWTRKCNRDLQRLAFDITDACGVVREALSRGKYRNSEWCKQNRCPICEAGELCEYMELIEVKYRTHKTKLDSFYSVCNACGSEQATIAQIKRNKRATIAFRKTVDGLLTGAEIRSLRKSLGLTQARAARIFGGGRVAFSKYEHDDVAQSDAMDKLLRLASAVPEALAHLEHADYK